MSQVSAALPIPSVLREDASQVSAALPVSSVPNEDTLQVPAGIPVPSVPPKPVKKRQREDTSQAEKREICMFAASVAKDTKWTHQAIADKFKKKRTFITMTLKHKDKWLNYDPLGKPNTMLC
jgi:hypothetical protein